MSQELPAINYQFKSKQENLNNSTRNLCSENLLEVIHNLVILFNNGQNEVMESVNQLKLFISQSSHQLQRQELIQNSNNFIQELTSYIGDWCSFCEKCKILQAANEHDIFVVHNLVIKDVKEILKHCKESSAIYEGHFVEVSSSLSNLFKSAYHTLKIMLEIAEGRNLDQVTDEDVTEFANGIMELFRLTIVLKDIDIMPLVTTLRSLNRILLSKRDFLHEKLDCIQIFTAVCSCITDKLYFCWALIEESVAQNQPDSKRSSKVIKILRFFVGMLLQLIKEYKNEIFGEATKAIINALLLLQWMTPMSLHQHVRGSSLYEEFFSSVLSVIEPLLLELLHERDFILQFKAVSGTLQGKNKKKDTLSALLVSVTIASLLAKAEDGVKNEWMNEHSITSTSTASIFEAALILFEECKKENLETVHLPSFVETGKPLRDIGLHEYSYVRICAFTATLNQGNFEKVEFSLLKNYFQLKDLSFFIADVISFIARWGPESLCFQLAEFFAHLGLAIFKVSRSIQSEIFNRCSFVLQRLFLLLGDTKKEEFLKIVTSSSEDFTVLCIMVPINGMSGRLFEKYLSVIANSTLKSLGNYKANGQLDMMMITIKVWEQCFDKEAFHLLPPVKRNAITAVLMDVFTDFENSECEEIDEQFVCLVLGATRRIIPFLESQQVQMILHVVLLSLECNHSQCLSIKSCQLLTALKSTNFSPDFQGTCLQCIAKIFQILLSHESIFVRHEAMKSLAEFAEVTNHSSIICQCVPVSSKESFASFLNQSILLDDIPEEQKEKRLMEAILSLSKDTEKARGMDTERPSNCEERPTGPTYNGIPWELQTLENDLKNSVDAIKNYSKRNRIPEWMTSRFNAIMKDMLGISSHETGN